MYYFCLFYKTITCCLGRRFKSQFDSFILNRNLPSICVVLETARDLGRIYSQNWSFLSLVFPPIMFFTLDLSDVFLWLYWIYVFFLARTSQKSVCPSQRIIIFGGSWYRCVISGDISFNHLVTAVSASFLHYKVTVFLFVINKNLVERYFETANILVIINYTFVH